MTESELYRALGSLTKNTAEWEAAVPFVSSQLASDSVKIRAKALWLLGEMGMKFPSSVQDHVPAIASFLDSAESLL
ncbi:MAG: HEAT repeat domain-containing protein, partial [Clostridia bacterium]|nr:HEAT repeat domain-containing protein [Clostridia bacterium]